MFRQSPKKIILIGIILLLLFSIGISISYANWISHHTQKENNIIGSTCFQLKLFSETDGIKLEKAMPLKDEEANILEGYTFTIKNICNTQGVYQVNLEEIIIEELKLDTKYIKVSLNNSKGKILNTYEEVRPTLEEANVARKLTSGSLKAGESVTYNLKLWLTEETPPLEENYLLKSKITVIATYKENIENEITYNTISLNETYSKEKETLQTTIKSKNYDLIEISEDGVVFNPIPKDKEYVYVSTYEKEGSYTIYVKDEVGNRKEIIINTILLDQSPPKIVNVISSPETWTKNSVIVTVDAKDEKAGLHEKAYSFDNGVTWQRENTKAFAENTENIIIKVRDSFGYISNPTNTKISNIDKIPPNAPTITNSSNNNWTNQNVTITLVSNDWGIGVDHYETLVNGIWTREGITYKNGVGTIVYSNEKNETVRFRAVDKLGNISNESSTNVKIDKTSPTLVMNTTLKKTREMANPDILENYTNRTIDSMQQFGLLTNQYFDIVDFVNDNLSGISSVEFKMSTKNTEAWNYDSVSEVFVSNIFRFPNANSITFANQIIPTSGIRYIYGKVTDIAGNIGYSKLIIKVYTEREKFAALCYLNILGRPGSYEEIEGKNSRIVEQENGGGRDFPGYPSSFDNNRKLRAIYNIIAEFYDSNEFRNSRYFTSTSNYVQNVYWGVLRRSVESEATLQGWINDFGVLSDSNRFEILHQAVISDEAKNSFNNYW